MDRAMAGANLQTSVKLILKYFKLFIKLQTYISTPKNGTLSTRTDLRIHSFGSPIVLHMREEQRCWPRLAKSSIWISSVGIRWLTLNSCYSRWEWRSRRRRWPRWCLGSPQSRIVSLAHRPLWESRWTMCSAGNWPWLICKLGLLTCACHWKNYHVIKTYRTRYRVRGGGLPQRSENGFNSQL